ncbi:hypothetical protein D3C80_2197770 [compost metagenome]
MHSYGTGVSQSTKLDNWAQLEKYFRKKDVPVTKQMIEDLLACKPNAAIPIVEALYSYLTDRP